MDMPMPIPVPNTPSAAWTVASDTDYERMELLIIGTPYGWKEILSSVIHFAMLLLGENFPCLIWPFHTWILADALKRIKDWISD